MRMVDLILKKKNSQELTGVELEYIVKGFVSGEIPDYQMSAFLMTVCFSGMTYKETAALTMAMADFGDRADLSDIPGIKVDKHSTGGVGDTTTLVAAPLVAACGGKVAKMSGRGLGHTGGTIDKLESIYGFNAEQSIERFKQIVNKIGVSVIGQTANLVPADKKMYALRDVTGTVNSIPLIASSIMSKKIAAGADAIVLDVKTGSGAFMQTVDDARSLAQTMVEIGEQVGRRCVAVITDMNQPLGLNIGNGLEVKEAVEMLSGQVMRGDPLFEVCMLLSCHMLQLSGLANDDDTALSLLDEALYSGAGLKKLAEMIEEQGGDPAVIKNPEMLCRTREKIDLRAAKSGYIKGMDVQGIGMAAMLLGAGREKKSDRIDPAVGLVLHHRLGGLVSAGSSLATLYVNDDSRLKDAMALLEDSIMIGDAAPGKTPIVYDVIKK
ncbi:MAG: Pyrimidine-nucleoside phosphorylase [Firmicutes bacterium ADurb.Bin182]|nr:MAG: Pyrimidine-nucleoside phosphorylase [Firmicutes bacterium ADurb.Bin182]